MNKLAALILSTLVLVSPAAFCQHSEDGEAARLAAEQARAEAMQSAELARQGAEAARAEAMKAAEMARLSAEQLKAERAAQKSEQRSEEAERTARERAVEKEELARAREELKRAHRELQRATREIARAHRDLARSASSPMIARHVNLGDRAVIGVVLGRHTNEGVEIIGVSPDGPAERAGIRQGDVLTSFAGVNLTDSRHARHDIYEVLGEAGDGTELPVTVTRDGETRELTIIAELREPMGWQSVIRIPDIEVVREIDGISPVVSERIEVPEIDEPALSARIDDIQAWVDTEFSVHRDGDNFTIVMPDQEDLGRWGFEGYSDMAELALDEARMSFGLPNAHGLELAAINEGLASYFKTDHGVLVINARENNAYQLEAGDVILAIDSDRVKSPSDVLRALRDMEPGQNMELHIKRDRRDERLDVVMPENRLGAR